jgi:cell wall-associated NlpC family hydrolase
MTNLKSIISFSLALFFAGSISINSSNIQAKEIVFGTKSVTLSATKSVTGSSIVAYAKKFIGIPYKTGGTTTSGFDCSGFTKYVYSHFNISLPHSANSQTSKGTVVSKANLRVGDLVFFGDSSISHVGMYVGNGKIIHSPKPGSSIQIAELKYMPDYNTARRLI